MILMAQGEIVVTCVKVKGQGLCFTDRHPKAFNFLDALLNKDRHGCNRIRRPSENDSHFLAIGETTLQPL